MVYYLEKYESLEEDKTEEDAIDDMLSQDKFKGYSIFLQPMSDLSYIDLLPELE